jgi:hypothetical protein
VTYLKKEETVPYKAMKLALRPEGVGVSDFPRQDSYDFQKTMGRLVKKGYMVRDITGKGTRHTARWRATHEQWVKYLAAGVGRPPRNNVFGKKESKAQVAKVSKTYVISRARMLAGWPADTEAYYPTDKKGQPLYKITVAPSPPDPRKTNTFSGAY